LGDKEINEDETSGTYDKYEAEENVYGVLVGKLKEEDTLQMGQP
jgi:hypothetical protein